MAQKRQPPAPAPVAQVGGVRLRLLREAASEGRTLGTAELASLTGWSVAGLRRLRSGTRLQGFRVRRVAGADGTSWQLIDPSGARTPGDPLRLAQGA